MKPKKPRLRDLGNDQFFIRTTTEGVMTDAGTRVALDLTKPTDRGVVRRMAIRMLDMCDWWESKTGRGGR